MTSISAEAVTKPAVLGEGPHWDPTENVLYYVDVPGKEIRRYDPATKRETIAKLDGEAASFIIPVQDQKHKFFAGIGHDICLLTWDGQSSKPNSIEKLATVDEEEQKQKNRLNDGKADASGRLWTGTMGEWTGKEEIKPHQASLFSFSKNKVVTKHVTDVTLSNGLTWSLDNKILYYIDSMSYKVDAFDFELQTGQISNRRTIFDFKANGVSGGPDGMTIDNNGKLWVACFGGSQVIQIDPDSGKLLQSVPVPASQVTSVAFGGANLDELYVTTAALSPDEKEKYPSAGCTFRIKGINVKGLPMSNVKT